MESPDLGALCEAPAVREPPPAPPRRCWALLPALALPIALTGLLLSRAPLVLAGRPCSARIEWVPALGLTLGLSLDGLGLLFALLVAGVGALVVVYSAAYMAGERGLGRYYGALSLFMLAMLGVVSAANLFTLLIFWELTSISSYLLIGFHHEDAASREAALQALLITGAGGVALLAGFVLLQQAYGTADLTAIMAQPGLLRGHPYYGWVLGLVLLGACTKSALFPFHIWLPRAMVAPTPVSAYLHSATMVKAGLYLLLRLSPLLGGTAVWQGVLLALGLVTMLLGAWRALRQRDLKAILAYTTISTLGTVVALLGLGGAAAVESALVLVAGHALYKGALFLAVGAVDHETGTRDVTLLGGLRGPLPRLAALSLLAALSMAGLPPTLGFLAKELGYAAALSWPAAGPLPGLVVLLLVAGNAANVALAVVLGYRIFSGRPGGPWPRKPHGAPWLMLLALADLTAASWALGLAPALLDGFVASSLGLLSPGSDFGGLRLWHGPTLPLALSAVTVAAGLGLYLLWPRLLRARVRACPLSASRAYSWLLETALPRSAACLARLAQEGSLRAYLLVILVIVILLAGSALVTGGLWSIPVLSQEGYTLAEVAFTGLLVAAALAVTVARTRLGAIVALGAVGAFVTLLYVRFSAPDLALTQLLIESLSVILLLLVVHFLAPDFGAPPRRRRIVIDAVVAVAVGLLMGVLVLVANGVQLAPSVAEYYLAQSLPLAHGRNVVNAIVADFRGFDTLGEITVLAAGALGLYTLVKGRSRKRGQGR